MITIIEKKKRFSITPKRLDKNFGLNDKSIALNVLHAPYNTKEIRYAYKLKYNLKRENQVILLMIIDGEKWHYLAVKKLSVLLMSRTTSKNVGEF